ncbi:hypothetical protein NQ318_017638 [Aromia moschata]|uniref:Uncharacterized protein n=1 Tax=Aromia moschata TaxID=1265417 RepID=A0AAV8Z2S5_9CUCU|nr:hypothetical protein NQ318_017638 [Aromia moschata]
MCYYNSSLKRPQLLRKGLECTISDSRNDNVRAKRDKVLKTNPDFITLRQIYDGVSRCHFLSAGIYLIMPVLPP